MDIQREDSRPEFNCCAVAHEDPLAIPTLPLPSVNYGLWTLNVITQQQSKRATEAAAGKWGETGGGGGGSGETWGKGRQRAKQSMKLKCA